MMALPILLRPLTRTLLQASPMLRHPEQLLTAYLVMGTGAWEAHPWAPRYRSPLAVWAALPVFVGVLFAAAAALCSHRGDHPALAHQRLHAPHRFGLAGASHPWHVSSVDLGMRTETCAKATMLLQAVAQAVCSRSNAGSAQSCLWTPDPRPKTSRHSQPAEVLPSDMPTMARPSSARSAARRVLLHRHLGPWL